MNFKWIKTLSLVLLGVYILSSSQQLAAMSCRGALDGDKLPGAGAFPASAFLEGDLLDDRDIRTVLEAVLEGVNLFQAGDTVIKTAVYEFVSENTALVVADKLSQLLDRKFVEEKYALIQAGDLSGKNINGRRQSVFGFILQKERITVIQGELLQTMTLDPYKNALVNWGTGPNPNIREMNLFFVSTSVRNSILKFRHSSMAPLYGGFYFEKPPY